LNNILILLIMINKKEFKYPIGILVTIVNYNDTLAQRYKKYLGMTFIVKKHLSRTMFALNTYNLKNIEGNWCEQHLTIALKEKLKLL